MGTTTLVTAASSASDSVWVAYPRLDGPWDYMADSVREGEPFVHAVAIGLGFLGVIVGVYWAKSRRLTPARVATRAATVLAAVGLLVLTTFVAFNPPDGNQPPRYALAAHIEGTYGSAVLGDPPWPEAAPGESVRVIYNPLFNDFPWCSATVVDVDEGDDADRVNLVLVCNGVTEEVRR